ncbi:hypothetical protein IP70_16425 [alpha proteobacterium AAP38]|uniref:hypothetical protein n=1 Tax=Niveispirillum sp. TaxID=1917217 RepID=UPI0006B9F343|nr:hypothetical protein IP70_16425 [alpha proteobacterium AAP38]
MAVSSLAVQRMQAVERPSLRDMLAPHGFPSDYKQFMYNGGLVYRTSYKEPRAACVEGWTKAGVDPDIVKHMTVDQGVGSPWISCCRDMMATKDLLVEYGGTYGNFLYEIELDNYQSIDAELAYTTIKHKDKSPFFWQQEVAVFKRIRGDQVIAVWIKRETPAQNERKEPYFASLYERYTREQVLRGL